MSYSNTTSSGGQSAGGAGTMAQSGTIAAPVFHGDPIPPVSNTGTTGADSIKAVVDNASGPHAPNDPPPDNHETPETLVAKHQPPAEGTIREFADHIDRERQAVKDWVRKEIGLLVQGKSHDERAQENP